MGTQKACQGRWPHTADERKSLCSLVRGLRFGFASLALAEEDEGGGGGVETDAGLGAAFGSETTEANRRAGTFEKPHCGHDLEARGEDFGDVLETADRRAVRKSALDVAGSIFV